MMQTDDGRWRKTMQYANIEFLFFYIENLFLTTAFSTAAPRNSDNDMNWFEQVFGFCEEGRYEHVRSLFQVSRDEERAILLTTVPPPGGKRK
jgi:hypothetical protein